MSRSRKSYQERQRISLLIDKHQSLDKRRRQLYNKKYHKSFFFISIWAGRLAFLILFIIVAVFYNKHGESREEIVKNKNTETYTKASKGGGSYQETTLYIETDYSDYVSKFGDIKPHFNIGDTLIIERNIFKKPIYFTKNNWDTKYLIIKKYYFFYIMLFITLISFFFNDGLDRFTDKILLIVWTGNIIGIACFFLIN